MNEAHKRRETAFSRWGSEKNDFSFTQQLKNGLLHLTKDITYHTSQKSLQIYKTVTVLYDTILIKYNNLFPLKYKQKINRYLFTFFLYKFYTFTMCLCCYFLCGSIFCSKIDLQFINNSRKLYPCVRETPMPVYNLYQYFFLPVTIYRQGKRPVSIKRYNPK